MEIRFARSATRHRVSRERSRYVVEHCGLRLRIAAPDPGHGDRFVYLGDDADGIPLEVIAIELGEDEILVIHAMPLRPRFREQYEEVTQWRV